MEFQHGVRHVLASIDKRFASQGIEWNGHFLHVIQFLGQQTIVSVSVYSQRFKHSQCGDRLLCSHLGDLRIYNRRE